MIVLPVERRPLTQNTLVVEASDAEVCFEQSMLRSCTLFPFARLNRVCACWERMGRDSMSAWEEVL